MAPSLLFGFRLVVIGARRLLHSPLHGDVQTGTSPTRKILFVLRAALPTRHAAPAALGVAASTAVAPEFVRATADCGEAHSLGAASIAGKSHCRLS